MHGFCPCGVEATPPPAPTLQADTLVTPAELVDISRAHLESMFMYHNELGNALANANREGEEARKEERMRIWGYS